MRIFLAKAGKVSHRFALLESHQDPVPQYGQSLSLSMPDEHHSWSALDPPSRMGVSCPEMSSLVGNKHTSDRTAPPLSMMYWKAKSMRPPPQPWSRLVSQSTSSCSDRDTSSPVFK